MPLWIYVLLDKCGWHIHVFQFAEHGRFEPLDSWYARYYDLYRCRCGESKELSEVALI